MKYSEICTLTVAGVPNVILPCTHAQINESGLGSCQCGNDICDLRINYCYFTNYEHDGEYIKDADVTGSTIGAMCIPSCIKNIESAWLCACEHGTVSSTKLDLNFTGNSCRDDGIYCQDKSIGPCKS